MNFKSLYKEIAKYDKAGSYTWTAPDYFNGAKYKIGACIIGAGSSGSKYNRGSGSGSYYVCGGGSGYVENATFLISPGQQIPLVIGKGGRNDASSGELSAVGGGSSSFFGVVAQGGESEIASINISNGADYGDAGAGHFGGRLHIDQESGSPWSATNLFTNTKCVGSGSGHFFIYDDSVRTIISKKDPVTGLGGGDSIHLGTNPNNPISVNLNATLNGCGGGSVSCWSNNFTAAPGAGGDGLVIIYLLGGSV